MQLILASGSAGRKAMLQNAGLNFTVIPANIDEDKITKDLLCKNSTPEDITRELAIQKSLSISALQPDMLVIGSDQTLVLDGKIFSKAKDTKGAEEKLKILRGKTHILNSAVCVCKNNKVLFETLDSAQLKMNNFTNDFLKSYMLSAKDSLTTCVGAYAIEQTGAWLFTDITGNYFTIMGMPLLPLLTFLQTQGFRP